MSAEKFHSVRNKTTVQQLAFFSRPQIVPITVKIPQI